MTSGHPQGFWEGVFSVPLRSLARRVRIEKRFVPFKSLFERDAALIFLQVGELFGGISKRLSYS